MIPNPAIEAFVGAIGTEKVWGQILIQPSQPGFTLRHIADRSIPAEQLKGIPWSDARKLAMFNATGQFRPLRAAPDLSGGWLLNCADAGELWRALQEFYPGSVADWFAVRNGVAPIGYREFTARQSGMYRITQLLTDEQAATVARATCHPRFCMKQRRWTVTGLEADSSASKSAVPCLEPCAVLLELARKASRIEQEEKLSVQLSRSDLESFLAAAKIAASSGLAGDRTGNVGAADNPRRLQLLIEKFKHEIAAGDKAPVDSEP